mmetsp:Transcript_85796/g.223612  ORF Transcript_85796/g.223612 Transcript_85796/m.223612 type:complete len:102 (+) Transcript_85796:77-382(+)
MRSKPCTFKHESFDCMLLFEGRRCRNIRTPVQTKRPVRPQLQMDNGVMSSHRAPLGVSAAAPSDGDRRGVGAPTVLLGLGDQGASSPKDVLACDIPSARNF